MFLFIWKSCLFFANFYILFIFQLLLEITFKRDNFQWKRKRKFQRENDPFDRKFLSKDINKKQKLLHNNAMEIGTTSSSTKLLFKNYYLLYKITCIIFFVFLIKKIVPINFHRLFSKKDDTKYKSSFKCEEWQTNIGSKSIITENSITQFICNDKIIKNKVIILCLNVKSVN